MIQVSTRTKDGKPALLLVLEAGNLKRLKKGEPIMVDGDRLGVPLMVFIDFAETQADGLKKLRALGLMPEADQ